MTITEFLEARIAEDEALARGAVGSRWDGRAFQQVRTEDDDEPHYYKILSGQVSLEHWEPKERVDPGTTFEHIARHDPARVLAECKAKRAMLDNVPKLSDTFDLLGGTSLYVLRCLAAVYMDHPDYQQEWVVGG